MHYKSVLLLITCFVLCFSIVDTYGAPTCHLNLRVYPPPPFKVVEGDTLMVVVKLEYVGSVRSKISLDAVGIPEFAYGWDDRERFCANCVVRDTIYFAPGFFDSDEYEITFIGTGSYKSLRKEVVCTLVVEDKQPPCRSDRPLIYPEPEFTKGTFNQICYVQLCNAYDHQVCYFDAENPLKILNCRMPQLEASQSVSEEQCVNIEGLEDGHKYGYFVSAYFLENPDSIVTSDTVFSVQDDSPPDSVVDIYAEADSGGVIVLRWFGVQDRVSFVKEYRIYRKHGSGSFNLIRTIKAEEDNDYNKEYIYTESLSSGSGLIEGDTYRYRVNAVDVVGNEGGGRISEPVVPDSTAPCTPELIIAYDYWDEGAYAQGDSAEVLARSDCVGIASADSILIEVARKDPKFFDTKWAPLYDYFESGWISCTDDWINHIFELLPPNGDKNYVNGNLYYFRAKAKDRVGNESNWSELDTVYMDCFAPSDISNLTVYFSEDSLINGLIVNLSWDEAVDHVSGLNRYIINVSYGSGYEPLDSVVSVSYTDTLELYRLDENTVCYRITSVDNVGNRRGIDETEWEACVELPSPPAITISCDTTLDDVCYIRGDILISWDGSAYNEKVEKLIIECNDTTYSFDSDKKEIKIPFFEDSKYRLRARVLLVNGIHSRWTQYFTVFRDHLPPEPVDYIAAYNDREDCIGYFIEWTESKDSSGIGGYEIWKFISDVDSIYIGETKELSYCIEYGDTDSIYAHGDTIYKEYRFKVFPFDILRNTQRNAVVTASTYCNKPPEINCPGTVSDNNCISIEWGRVVPSLVKEEDIDSLRYVVSVNALNAEVEQEDTVRAFNYKYCAKESDYYEFKIKELSASGKESRWSRPCLVAFNHIPREISELIIQPQPVLPEHLGDKCGIIDLHWNYLCGSEVQDFEISRWLDGELDTTTMSLPCNSPTDSYWHFRDSTVVAERLYTYKVKVVDVLGQLSEGVVDSAIISPVWMYTPKLMGNDNGALFFNSDTLVVKWDWLGADSITVVGNIYGASECYLEVSTRNSFDVESQKKVSGWVDANSKWYKFYVRDLIDPSNKSVYCRIKARDRWGNESPYSEVYFSSDREIYAIYDDLAPWPVRDLYVYSRADTSIDSDSVLVHLKWSRSEDVKPGSGLKWYNIYYRFAGTDGDWNLLSKVAAESTEYSAKIKNPDEIDRRYEFTVCPEDSLGNIEWSGNAVKELNKLEKVCGLKAHSKRRISWEYDLSAPIDYFVAECSYRKEYLGTKWMNYMPREAIAIIADTLREYEFETDDNFTKHDTIYFHIKAVIDGCCESPWSEVVSYPAGHDSVFVDYYINNPKVKSKLFQN